MAKKDKCCCRFPLCAFLLLVVGVLWLLSDLNVISVQIPWVPVILIIFSLGLMKKHMYMHEHYMAKK